MKDTVLASLKTTFEASELTRALHALLQSGASDKRMLADEAVRLLPGGLAKALVDQINASEDVKAYLNALAEAVEKVEVVHLGLAIEPTGELIERLSLWFDKNLSQTVIMEFELKPQLIAGASVAYKGKFGDYSLAKKLDDYLEKNKAALAKEIIKHDAV